jgi:hypothetical protein
VHCPQELLLLGVRWAETSLLRSRHGAELRAERGVPVDHATIERGGVPYSPLLAAACHRSTRSVWGNWRRDETSRRGKGQWDSLAHAVAKTGQTSACLLTEPWDAAATRQTSPAPAGVSVGGPARSYRFRRGTSYPHRLAETALYALCTSVKAPRTREYRKYKATFHGATFHGTPAGASQQPASAYRALPEPPPPHRRARGPPALPAADRQARAAGTDRTGAG